MMPGVEWHELGVRGSQRRQQRHPPGPGELVVSRTITALVAGSGIAFDDLGARDLKGVQGTWNLYAVRG
jgi:hypothetical protein